MPAVKPLIFIGEPDVALTVATAGVADDQVPPETLSVNEMLLPVQTVAVVKPMAAGGAPTTTLEVVAVTVAQVLLAVSV